MKPVFIRKQATVGISRSFPTRKVAAFTLVELLVVIGLIGVLAAMLLPALARSKDRAQAVLCMNNGRQLALAWTLYSGENNDQLVYNLGGDADRSSFAPRQEPDWVNNIMDWTLSQDNTNTDFVNTSMLGSYASYSTAVYKCPSDRALSDVQRQAGWRFRVRSVSMNAMMGNPGSLLVSGTNVNNGYYRQFLKDSDISDPARIFVFLDEHPDSINDGYFLITPSLDYGSLAWSDLPASYHSGGCSFSFADGHMEVHHWIVDSTKCPNVPEERAAADSPLVRDGQTADFNWVLKRSSVRP